MHRVRTLALAAALLSACTLDPGKLDPRRSASAVCPVLFDQVVAKFQACEGLAPYYADRMFAATRASCSLVSAGEAAGRIGYDRAVADACLAALDPASGCASLSACDAPPFVGQVTAGGTCYDQIECAAGLTCSRPEVSGACPGTCKAAGAVGARCLALDPPCDDTSYCDTTPVVPTCAARAGLGQPCSSTIPCAPHLGCVQLTVLQCVSEGGLGAPCSSTAPCDSSLGLYCDANALPATCKAISTRQAQGQSCAYPNTCGPGLFCDPSQVCQAELAVGAACAYYGCQPPARCVLDSAGATTSHCVKPLAEGQACTPGLRACEIGLYCAALPGGAACTRFPGVGGLCGALSGEDVGCLDGWCNLGTGSGGTIGTCTAWLASGASCTSDAQCGGGGIGATGAQCVFVAGAAGRICLAACVP